MAVQQKKSGSPFRKEKLEAIYIQCEFFTYAQKPYPEYSIRDVYMGKVKRDKVIKDSFQFVKRIGDLLANDLSNMKQCISFLTKRFPHVIISYSAHYIDIYNLNQDEMGECLCQPKLHFKFIESVRKNGSPTKSAQK